jgi:hypothetical protein
MGHGNLFSLKRIFWGFSFAGYVWLVYFLRSEQIPDGSASPFRKEKKSCQPKNRSSQQSAVCEKEKSGTSTAAAPTTEEPELF